MIQQIPKGRREIIQGLTCYTPPVGHVVDWQTGAIKKTGIIQRSNKKSEQYWERMPLPKNWKKKRKEEKRIQRYNESHVDPELQEYRMNAWARRLEGMWFMNKGKATYITGLHYFYLNWIYIGGDTKNQGYPDFRENDRKFFYFLDYVLRDEGCFGMVYVTKRREGKTSKSAAFILEGVTRKPEANAGIQSKSDEDARNVVYRDGVLKAFLKLPDFFQPTYYEKATRKSILLTDPDNPDDDTTLGGWINYAASTATAYDGKKLFRYVGDEVFKTETSVRERHEIVLPTLEDPNGRPYGKILLTSTVEEMKGKVQEYIDFWKQSDQTNRDKITGFTGTKLFRYFTPADEAMNYDIYGFCDKKKNREFILAERNQVKDQPKEYNDRVRKKPLTIEEAFRVSADNRVFDADRLINRYEAISWRKDIYETGDFIWKKGEKDTEVEWRPTKRGRWKIVWHFVDDSTLQRPYNLTRPRPWNNHRYTIGCDPYSHSRTEDYRNSNGAFYVYRKGDMADPHKSDAFCVEYCARPATSDIFFEDLIKTMFYFGCSALVENNRNNILDYIKYRGYEEFAMKLPDRKEPGIPGNTKSHGDIIAFTEAYIYNHLDKVYFAELIDDWTRFDPFDTTEFDRAMAAGYTLIADNRYRLLLKKLESQKMHDVKKLFG